MAWEIIWTALRIALGLFIMRVWFLGLGEMFRRRQHRKDAHSAPSEPPEDQ